MRMKLFSNKKNKISTQFDDMTKQVEAIKEIVIQAYPEGSKSRVDLENLLYGNSLSQIVPGITNSYTDYESQTSAIYEKYNGMKDFGSQLVRTIIDFRTSFIAGEGISVSSKDEKTSDWIKQFIKDNKLNGSMLINMVKGSEMAGQSIATLSVENKNGEENKIVIKRKPYNVLKPYRVKYNPETYEIIGIQEKKDLVGWQLSDIKDYIYIRTGGDDVPGISPTTRTGIVLTDIDNYDRALKDIRRNNHIFARVTPVFKVDSESEASQLKTWLSKIQWKIGTAFIGKAKFSYESPTTTAYQNLVSELTSVIKTISGITGVPVHWMGHVDLMSNRSTAESLYEVIKNATMNERSIWEESLYDIILKAQEMYINNGGTDIKLNRDFDVKLPLIDLSNFLDRVRSLQIAYADGAISIDDYRNNIPGIDPLQTAKVLGQEQKELEQQIIKMGINNPNPNEEEIEDGEE